MNKETNKSNILSSLLWKFMERGGTQGIQFIVSIILARLLLPTDYGIIALVTIFTSIAATFVTGGFGSALIQKKDADETDFSSVFFSSLVVAILLYLLIFLSAPLIGKFYDMPEVVPVLRVLAVTLVANSINSVQNAIISKNLMFRLLFFRSTGALFISGPIGITMAYMGFGVWALVAQIVSNQFFITFILWFTLKWRPKLLFSFSRIKGLFSYGWKLLVASLLNSTYSDLRVLLIGKLYSPVMLGLYNRGQSFPSIIVGNIDGSIQAVMFPVLSAEQDDRGRVKSMVRRAIVTSSFIIFPMMVGVAAVAEPLVKLLLTDKWIQSVPFIQIFAVAYAFHPIQASNLQAIKSLGRSDIFLKLEVLKKVIALIILGITMFLGVHAIALGVLLTEIISSFINAYPNKHLLNYSYIEQWKDIAPALLISLAMGVVVFSLKWLGLSSIWTLLVQVAAGLVIYPFLAWAFKLESFFYIKNTAGGFLKEKLSSRFIRDHKG